VDAARAREGDAEAVSISLVRRRGKGNKRVLAVRQWHEERQCWVDVPVKDGPFLVEWFTVPVEAPWIGHWFTWSKWPATTSLDRTTWTTEDGAEERALTTQQLTQFLIDGGHHRRHRSPTPDDIEMPSTWMEECLIGVDTDHLLALDSWNEHLMRGMEYGYHV
jgi:hypothetical protein